MLTMVDNSWYAPLHYSKFGLTKFRYAPNHTELLWILVQVILIVDSHLKIYSWWHLKCALDSLEHGHQYLNFFLSLSS